MGKQEEGIEPNPQEVENGEVNCSPSTDDIASTARTRVIVSARSDGGTLWLTGRLFGKKVRKSAKTRNWEAAEKIKRKVENGEETTQEKSISLEHALDAYLRDCGTRNLAPSTQKKYRALLQALEFSAKLATLTDVVVSPPTLLAIFALLGISPQEALKRNSNISGASSRSASRTSGSQRSQ